MGPPSQRLCVQLAVTVDGSVYSLRIFLDAIRTFGAFLFTNDANLFPGIGVGPGGREEGDWDRRVWLCCLLEMEDMAPRGSSAAV